MAKYEKLCQGILAHVGGKENISFVTHCATRLRMNLKDQAKVDQEKIKKIKGVLGCQFSGGQFQVIIGQNVDDVYNDFIEMTGFQVQNKIDEQLDSIEEKFSWKQLPNKLIDAVSGCVTPILPIITAAGIIKLIVALLGESMLNVLPATSDFMVLLTFVGDAGFYFFPVFIAVAASKKFNTSTPIALFLGAILVHPTLVEMVTKGTQFSVYGIPMTLVNYSSQFLPSILIVWVMSYVYKFFDKFSPKSMKIILVPTCTILVMLPLALCILGPIASFLGQGLAAFFTNLYSLVGPLAIGLISASWYFLVATGMHHALVALAITQIANMGADSIIMVGAISGTYALMGLAVAYIIRCKKEDKAIAAANAVTLIVGGVINGLLHVSVYFNGSSNVLIGLDFGKDLALGMIGCGAAFVISLVLGTVLGIDDSSKVFGKKNKKDNVIEDKNTIYSPLTGKVISLSDVNDQAFASGSMGEGCAIIPEIGQVLAPFNGTVVALFPTKHAIGLKSDEGVEVLIHVGLDTVNDQGKDFTSKVKMGDTIVKGQILIEFNKDALIKKGYDLTTPVIITYGGEINQCLEHQNVQSGNILLNLKEE